MKLSIEVSMKFSLAVSWNFIWKLHSKISMLQKKMCTIFGWNLVKLYAPEACFTFFGIFQEYSMEYSIFQNFGYFECLTVFLEYSSNIPYSTDFNIFLVILFFGIFHIPKFLKSWLLRKILGIFHIPWTVKKILLKERNGIFL